MKIKRIIAKFRKRIKFRRQGWYNLVRLGEEWRRPKGRHNKLRRKFKGKGIMPNKGYRTPRKIRNVHPSGLKEVRVSNLNDAKNVGENVAVRIDSNIGKRKREEILKILKEKNVKILNG